MAPDPLPAVLPGGADDAWHQRMRLERELHDGPALRLSALALRATIVYIELATALLKKLLLPDPPALLSVTDYSVTVNT